jgi:Flp pilus assembly protein TadB
MGHRTRRRHAPPEQTAGAKLPRAVRLGPPITLTCECGTKRDLPYGERWRCESCGRTWDTNRIPIDEYAAIRRTQVRYRLLPVLSGVLMLVAVLLFVIAGRAFGAILIVPLGLSMWNMFMRPLYKRRYRKALTERLPTWDIKAD